MFNLIYVKGNFSACRKLDVWWFDQGYCVIYTLILLNISLGGGSRLEFYGYPQRLGPTNEIVWIISCILIMTLYGDVKFSLLIAPALKLSQTNKG